jgi:predicted nuclease with RNAse H fold
VKTLGIDLAADPKRTAAAVIEWRKGQAQLVHLTLGVTDETVVELFGASDVTGIDCPLGWPRPFLSFLLGHSRDDPDAVLRHDGLAGRRELAYRAADRFVTHQTGLIPLSVSADRLAHPAMRCAVIQAKIALASGIQPRDGTGRLIEVYPAASLRIWGISARRYKGRGTPESEIRDNILGQLTAAAPWLDLDAYRDQLIASDDLLDSVIASLTARAAANQATLLPSPDQDLAAREEGWIHLPTGSLSELNKIGRLL